VSYNLFDLPPYEDTITRILAATTDFKCNCLETIRDDYPAWQFDYCPTCGEKL